MELQPVLCRPIYCPAEQKRLNEQYINALPKISVEAKTELPYSTEFIQYITNQVENLNK